MKLNPAKCAFDMESGKFLGFMVNHWGIKVKPTKAQVGRLTGMVAALSRFVSRSTDKCHPFFQVHKGKDKIN